VSSVCFRVQLAVPAGLLLEVASLVQTHPYDYSMTEAVQGLLQAILSHESLELDTTQLTTLLDVAAQYGLVELAASVNYHMLVSSGRVPPRAVAQVCCHV
jgi:hypothetical protein